MLHKINLDHCKLARSLPSNLLLGCKTIRNPNPCSGVPGLLTIQGFASTAQSEPDPDINTKVLTSLQEFLHAARAEPATGCGDLAASMPQAVESG